MQDSLINSGLSVIGDKDLIVQDQKTIVVVGVARGGTSMVAGSLFHLGVFGGEKVAPPVFEDVVLASAFEKRKNRRIYDIVRRYNQNHSTWFFKRPSVIDYLDEINTKLRNPVFIFIFRDIFAVSNRNKISMGLDFFTGLKKAQADYGKIVKFLNHSKNINALLVSYEKALIDKVSFLDALTSTLFSKPIPDFTKQKVLNFIEPSPDHYLDVSRSSKVNGKIESISTTMVSGWAKKHHGNDKANIELYINGQKQYETVADKSLGYLADQNQGNGFVFNLDKPLKDNDEVSVRAAGEVNEVKGSPFVYKASELVAKADRQTSTLMGSEQDGSSWLFTATPTEIYDQVSNWFQIELGSDNVLFDDGPVSSHTSEIIKQSYSSEDTYDFWQRSGVLENIQLICSKDYSVKYTWLIPASRLMTFIIDPLKNILRTYDFLKRYKGYSDSFENFITLPQYQNMQFRKTGATPAELIGFIGVIEQPEETTRLLAEFFQLDLKSIDDVSFDYDFSPNEFEMSDGLMALVRKNNQKEFDFYDKSRHLLFTRLDLQKKRKSYVHGSIHLFNSNRVAGYAFSPLNSKPVRVEIFINGKLVKNVFANEKRPHLMAYNVPRAGFVGFSYNFNSPLEKEDICECRVAETEQLIL